MKQLHIDIETYSSEPIADVGLYKYAMSPDFEIMLVAYAYGDSPTQIIDLTRTELPQWFIKDLLDPKVRKLAHNAAFERVCFTMHLRKMGILPADKWLSAQHWFCTMVQCARCGLPLSLKDAGAALGLEQQKMKEGANLIKKFCVPQSKTTQLFGARIRPEDAPEAWDTFCKYCIRDVEVERQIYDLTSWYEVSDFEQTLYALDQAINDHGVCIDDIFVQNAIKMRDTYNAKLMVEAATLTGLTNPNSLPALKAWYEKRTGQPAENLWTKGELSQLINSDDKVISRVAVIRSSLGKTSNAKYDKMQEVRCADGRARGLAQFYGTRTGRWAGRLLQLQNLPQNHLDDIDYVRSIVREGDMDMASILYENIPDMLSQLIRTALVAAPGKTFAVCDFSAIEARVVAWVAGEEWILDTFRKGGDIYCATASQMFGVPVAKHGPNAELRQKGKISVLALGYGGGVGALTAMGAIKMGLDEEELPEIVSKWRSANPRIVDLWSDIENAVCYTITTKLDKTTHGLTMSWQANADTLTITLPSGRCISYPHMTSGVNKFGKPSLKFKGLNQTTNKYEWIETWGGKLTENVVQAIARDCLAFTMMTMYEEGFKDICFHVHDEIIAEVDSPEQLKDVCDIFSVVPDWAEGLPLKGAGYTTPYYLKD